MAEVAEVKQGAEGSLQALDDWDVGMIAAHSADVVFESRGAAEEGTVVVVPVVDIAVAAEVDKVAGEEEVGTAAVVGMAYVAAEAGYHAVDNMFEVEAAVAVSEVRRRIGCIAGKQIQARS